VPVHRRTEDRQRAIAGHGIAAFWLTGCREREALPGLFVEVARERPPLRDGDVAARWTGFDVPTIVADRPGWLSVKRRTNSMLLIPASLSRPAMPEVFQFRWPTPGSWLSGPVCQFLSSAAAPRRRG